MGYLRGTKPVVNFHLGNLTSWHLRFWSLWTVFTLCCPLSWLPIWHWNVVMDPCFIHCHILHEKIFFIALKELQTALWIIDALLFMIDYEQTRFPFRIELSHVQISMQDGKYTTLLISSRCQPSRVTSIYDRPKPFCGPFLCFLKQLPN